MPECFEAERLRRYLEQGLSEGEARAVEAHVQACRRCEEALARLAEGVGSALPWRLDGRHRASPAAALSDSTAQLTPEPGSDRTPDPNSSDPTPATDLPRGAPSRAGRLALLGELGAGGMGVVFRGHDPALNRDLAVKVLHERYQDRPEMARRFLEEAQVCSQLQHPAIVPVHDLGTLADGRPFFSMKLVKGQTLARLLAQGADRVRDRPRFLKAFEQVCQALADAHSKHVLHRDLKPANVMVGAFGEVQVMDWGLAKVLAPGGPVQPPGPADGTAKVSTVRTLRSAGELSGSQAGTALGTPAYMAPEQALAESERIDARADVFGLGAILCEVLTGQPPYTAADSEAVFRKAVRADLAEAFARLDGCGADAELVALAKRCLAAEPAERPRDAGVVAEAVATYQARVQERLRTAERERAAAEARAEEAKATAAAAQAQARAERRALRRTLLAAAAVLVLLGLGGTAGAWYAQQRSALRREATRELDAAFDALQQEHWAQAKAAVGRAGAVLSRGGPADLTGRLEEAQGLLAWADELDGIRQDRWAMVEGKFSMKAAVPRYAASFATRGLVVGEAAPDEVAARVRASPIRGALLDALDDWWALDRKGGGAVLEVLRRAGPEGFRAQVREAAARRDGKALRVLAEGADVEALPAAALVVLAEALPKTEAVQLLRRAAEAHRSDFWIHFQLANQLNWKRAEESAEALGHYWAALALRPESAMVLNNLGVLLRERKDLAGAEKAYREAIRLDPNYAQARNNLGVLLREHKDLAGAEKAYREAIRSDPNFALARNNLGGLLHDRKDLAGAEQAYREAIRLDPNHARAHFNLGLTLRDRQDLAGAEKALREAIRSDPNFALAHYGLGLLLREHKDLAGAEKAYREAIRLDPNFALARNNLGGLLHIRKDLAGAEKAWREAIRLDPNFAPAHYNLGKLLHERKDLVGAEKAYREAIRLDPNFAPAHCNLGLTLRDRGRFRESLAELRRGHELGSRMPGWNYPSARWIRQTERSLALEGRLPAMLQFEAAPAMAAEAVEFARLCALECKRHYATSARLFAEAFAADPRLADDLAAGHRYNAACSAALAAAGRDAAGPLPDKRAERLRAQALGWLRADLAAWAQLRKANPATARAVAQRLRHWQTDADLAGVRDPAALAPLPDAERVEWQKLWADVADLLARVAPEPLPPPRPAPDGSP